MAIICNEGDARFNSGEGSCTSFSEHSRHMRAFRLAHPRNWKRWGYRVSRVRKSPLVLVPIISVRGVLLVTYSPN